MPDGAQAWKMIKTPGTHTDRIAQACDRCRSKKIRCDGLRPHCSQCLAVGFECKISDKLTRRAFPRGYTESLEDRIRQLETENGRLSNLLDVKDEQMEMISRVEAVHDVSPRGSFSSAAKNRSISEASTNTLSPANSNRPSSISSINQDESSSPESPEEDDDFVVNHMNHLGADGTYRGTSAGGVFINSFIQKLRVKNSTILPPVQRIAAYFTQTTEGGIVKSALKTSHPTSNMNNGDLLSPPTSYSDSNNHLSSLFPSRLSTDKLVTVYFQEWQSVYAILDQTKFLSDYQKFIEDEDDDSTNSNELYAASLALVLGLACLANKEGSSLTNNEVWKLDALWKRILSSRRAPSLELLQVCCLAQLYSMHVGNLDDVWYYRTLATSTALRLGLHRSRKAIRTSNGEPLSAYESELSRRVFWVVYTLDVFSSAILGSPRILNDNQIQCCMPKYVDDEVVADSFVTPPPSSPESVDGNNNSDTPASCQVSVIQFSRILANILDTVYSPKKSSHRPKTILMLEDQLESWFRDLPSSLKFEFVNGMPTASLSPVHQKSPLLLMLYHYARVLIHLPATADETNTSTYGSSSIVAVMQSAKTYIQVFNYLKARNVTSTLPLSPTRVMILFGSIILFCAIDYSRGGALLQQSRKLISQGLGYLYNDMQIGLPGSISGECFQWLEEICDSILTGNPSQHRRSSGGISGKPKSDGRSRSQEKKRSSSKEQEQPLAVEQSIQPKSQSRSPNPRVKIEPSPPYNSSQVASPSYQQIIIPQQPILDSNTSALLATANLMGVPFQLQQQPQQSQRPQQQQQQQPQQQQLHVQQKYNPVPDYRYNQQDYRQQGSTSYYPSSAIVNNVIPTSPVDDFFDTSSFEDFDINSVLDPISIKQETNNLGQNTSTNTFLENFNWDDSYNWSSMTV